MDLFDTYEEDFLETKTTIEGRVKKVPDLDGVQREKEIQQAEVDISEAEQTLRSMALSARNIGNNGKYLQKIKDYESEVAKLKTGLRKAEMQVAQTTEREQLFAGLRYEDKMASSMDQRERLLANTDRLEKSSSTLKKAMAEAEETVQIGVEALENLDEQKQTMIRIKGNLGKVQEQLGKAGKIMRSMGRRAVTNKLIMAAIMLMLIFVIIMIVYFKWFYHAKTKAVTPPPPSPVQPTTS